MFTNIKEMRDKKENGTYNLTIEIPEKDFFKVYNSVNNNVANDLIRQYLVDVQDDARFDNVKIKHNKNRHTIRLTSELNYYGNEHTDYNRK
ncbi:hypothetical protein [Tepidibacter formicigenes]|jgi:hypothetical protein|uniref:Uncharacterized protein n=1 Tax=Tepidibacter formicigenes DSM 15518 TaxID=1123349 RepID=A0A1M6SER6_9FIRM|nr:hypothetical protein [Tepidibacter formicigenes]SHK43175.1 hypothetical protein SAMN02744037_02326 [Tepidibacter formicigenes DSM 15518]